MEGNTGTDKMERKSDKKPRKRMKALLTKIREQMEFYFSNANLQKDRFLKKTMDETSDKFVDLEVFLSFNRIMALTTELDVLRKAVSHSTFLQLNEDKTKVRRTTPFKEAKDVDERTVYVECLPAGVDHDWIKRVFSACGKVLYVSLPKYRSTGDSKGFAFVEFDTIESAQKACETMNNPPADAGDQPGKFPKSSKTMRSLEKHLPELAEQPADRKEEHFKESTDAVKIDANKVAEEPVVKPSRRERKRQRQISEGSTESTEDSVVKKKQKLPDSSESPVIKPGVDSHVEGVKEHRSTPKRKRHESEEVVQDPSSKFKDTSDSECKQKTEKRKSQDTSTDHFPPKKQAKVDPPKEKTKKKKNRARRRKNKEREVPEIRVLSKHEWLALRKEYITLQKKNMANLKRDLLSLKAKPKKTANGEPKVKAPKTELVFTPGVIVQVKSENPLKRTVLKDQLSHLGDISYLDVKDGLMSGYIRCASAESASKIQTASMDGCSFTLLQGEDEKQYWEKIKSDRLNKFNPQTKTKKRGSEKLIEKGERAQANVVQGKHVIFADV